MNGKGQGQEVLMHKVREVLRLGLKCGLGQREIAGSCSISHPTAGKYLQAVQKAGISYEEIEKMDDRALRALIKRQSLNSVRKILPEPDWAYIHREMKRKGVTLQLLWEEYKDIHPEGYQTTQFCEHYQRWRKTLKLSMRLTHKAGEKMFVDYAGHTILIRDRHKGTERKAEIFVAVLGASNYTYVEASWDQKLSNWIMSHVRTFEYFGGVTRIVVPDNLRAGVSKACRYEPDINPAYQDMAAHYGTVIIPGRVRKPKDKAKVEVGVQIVSRWILARLRNRIFFSLRELNEAIWEELVELNQRSFKKLDGSRVSWFKEIEQKELLPLPAQPYELAQWKKARINIDYHVELNKHYYSVPYKLRGQVDEVYIRYTETTVEIMCGNKCVASHMRDDTKGRHTTVKKHMPESHRWYLEWSPSRIINWAKQTGKSTAQIVEGIMNRRKHPEQGYRSCLGILRLAKKYSPARLEAACRRACAIRAYSYKSIRSILEKGLDEQPLSKPKKQLLIEHENIRGGSYFDNQEDRVC